MKAVLCGILKQFILEPVDTHDSIELTVGVIMQAVNDTIRVKFISRND